MKIRKGTPEDLQKIMEIYDSARKFMRSVGNMNQWINGYPAEAIILEDMEKGHCFVCEEEGEVCGVFAFIIGADPTYSYIEGQWLNDETYGTIHRIAGDGKVHGVMKAAVDYAWEKVPNLRIDTHADNKPMQKQILKNGFTRCGIIYLANGDPRIAYQKASK